MHTLIMVPNVDLAVIQAIQLVGPEGTARYVTYCGNERMSEIQDKDFGLDSAVWFPSKYDEIEIPDEY